MIADAQACKEYVSHVLQAYRATPGTTGKVRKPDRLLAIDLFNKGIPVAIVENALILGAARRLIRPNGSVPLPPARSFAYFFPIIEEVQQMEVGSEYFAYIRRKLEKIKVNKPRSPGPQNKGRASSAQPHAASQQSLWEPRP